MIKQALLIASLVLGSLTTQADTLVISGSFHTKFKANGQKAEHYQKRDKYYLYSDGTFMSDDGEDWGKYTHKGNKYVLRINPKAWADVLAEDDITLDDYTSLKINVELNKNRSKANVKSNITVWISNEDNEQVKVRAEMSCKCSVKKIKD